MDAFIVTLIVIGLIVYGLERNRRHQAQPRSRLAGSSDIVDRDRERFVADLRARY
ncbi:MAG TPA: hypothetical protein VGX25_10925 [Actinophytocola sp.]|uniref:hypothetical protein n=1 Tax=Actinophytocola sp. TaxID=1872138 RepID=UPI002DDD2C83|nr:hypothetical protein [Actinophytocola sp.]HEV2779899.1 hypothetical protein [Actinophytocola sp.]